RRRGARGAAPSWRIAPRPWPYAPAGKACARGRRPPLRALGAARLVRPRRLSRARRQRRAPGSLVNLSGPVRLTAKARRARVGYGGCSARCAQTAKDAAMPKTRSKTNAIDLLKEDHAKVKKAFKEFEDMDRSDTETCRQLIQTVCEDLKVHTTLEEEIFYPAVRAAI